MEYKLGNSKRIKKRGETLEITCPKCNKEGHFGVFSNFEIRLSPKPTLLDLNTVYFLVCPNCAAIYTVDKKTGKSFYNGEYQINADDLFELEAVE